MELSVSIETAELIIQINPESNGRIFLYNTAEPEVGEKKL